MELNQYHRQLLGMRTYLNKFALQTGYATIPSLADLGQAVQELIDNGYVTKIDTYFNMSFYCHLDVFQLTPEGIELVERENIVAVSP